ncbi:MAG: fructosamine kinase family protein [Bacteroidales bacterium]|jgi:fructosamine-3-kinase|nr:fructosamine kinase family protein [Bacteroidales bacterium]
MLPTEIEKALSFQIYAVRPLSGGSINRVYFLSTDQGSFCLKFNLAKAFPGMFETEAKGLSLLEHTGKIRVPAVVGAVTLTQYSYLLLEYIEASRRIPDFMADFGRSLAMLHKNSNSRFGLDHANYIGSLPQQNKWHDDWNSFFVEERLEYQIMLARNSGVLSENTRKQFDLLFPRLKDLFPKENPALIHGDLWSGNFITSETGRPCLIDPAVYYGHREIDLAMSTLFGGFSSDFYTSYDEVFPLEKGWRARLDLYNLYPLLVHLNLFGSGYLGSILSILKKFS